MADNILEEALDTNVDAFVEGAVEFIESFLP